jgi:uncharacterized protein (DUF433 family)
MSFSYLDRIGIDPQVMVGKPVVKGTRIPVALVLSELARDLDVETLIEAYPRLTFDDIRACLEYAQELVEGEGVFRPVEQSTTYS